MNASVSTAAPAVPEIPGSDLQFYFSTTVEYLRSQPGRAMRAGATVCSYETETGNRCAVGLWIPERHPGRQMAAGVAHLSKRHPDLAGIAWPVAGDEDPDWNGRFSGHDPAATVGIDSGLRLAIFLQELHDRESFRTDGNGLSGAGERRAEWVANQFGLDYTEPAS